MKPVRSRQQDPLARRESRPPLKPATDEGKEVPVSGTDTIFARIEAGSSVGWICSWIFEAKACRTATMEIERGPTGIWEGIDYAMARPPTTTPSKPRLGTCIAGEFPDAKIELEKFSAKRLASPSSLECLKPGPRRRFLVHGAH